MGDDPDHRRSGEQRRSAGRDAFALPDHRKVAVVRADNRANNEGLVERLQGLARDKGCSAVQLAVAWVLAKGRTIVPVIGARKRTQLEESLAALNVQLSSAELARIEEALPPVAGPRYGEDQMKALDSER